MSLTVNGLEQASESDRGGPAPVLHLRDSSGVPYYLKTHYWWAYVHPRAVKIFERQWLTNLILWGNYGRLRDAALGELGESLPGRTLQVACVYGDLTCRVRPGSDSPSSPSAASRSRA